MLTGSVLMEEVERTNVVVVYQQQQIGFAFRQDLYAMNRDWCNWGTEVKYDSGNAVACSPQSWINQKTEEVKMMRYSEEYDKQWRLKQRKLGWQKLKN